MPCLHLSRLLGALAIAAALSCADAAFAVSAEEILEVLKKKGIITQEEYEILRKGPAAPASGAAPPAAAPAQRAQPAARAAKATAAQREPAERKAASKTQDEVRAHFKEGLVWESADKAVALGVRGRVVTDYRNFGGQDAIGADTFDVRQAYFGVDGKFYDAIDFRLRGDWSTLAGAPTSVCTSVNFANGSASCSTAAANQSTTHLDEAWFNLGWWKVAQLRLGQFRVPYGFELSTSLLNVDFAERAMLSALDPNKDRGVLLHGAPAKGVYYGLSYANGSGKNVNDTNQTIDSKDVGLRLAANFAEIFGAADSIYHVGATYTRGKIPAGPALPSVRTEGRGVSFFPQLSLSGGAVNRTRAITEGALAYGPLKLQSEYFKVNFDGEGFERDIKGYYASLTWLITGERYADAYAQTRMNRLRPKNDFAPGKHCCGAFELGLRYSKFDGDDFGDIVPATGATVATAWTLGVKWLVNPNTRFLLNYVKTEFGNDITINPAAPGSALQTDNEKALTLRGQFDF